MINFSFGKIQAFPEAERGQAAFLAGAERGLTRKLTERRTENSSISFE